MINGIFTRYRAIPYSTGGGASVVTLFTTTKKSLISIEIGGVGVISQLKIYWSASASSYRVFFDGQIGITPVFGDDHYAQPVGGMTLVVPAGQPIRASKNGIISGTIHVMELE